MEAKERVKKFSRNIEDRTRDMLGHAMRGEVDKIAPILQGMDLEQIHESVNLCILVSGYIAIDIGRSNWPNDAFIRRIAENAVKAENELNFDVEQVYNFLSRVALGFEPVDKVFTDAGDVVLAPILITGSLLLTFSPKGKNQWEWLDEIEAATEVAASMNPSVYPAVVLRSQIPRES